LISLFVSITAEAKSVNDVVADAGEDHEVCQGGCPILGGASSTFANFQWTVVSGDPNSIAAGQFNVSHPRVCPKVDTEYQVVATNPANGCTATDRVIVTINSNLNPIAEVDFSYDCKTSILNLDATGSQTPPANSGSSLNFIWFDNINPNSGFLGQSTVINVTTSTPDDYYLILVGDNTCADTVVVNFELPDCTVLPLQLSSFSGRYNDKSESTFLQWSTQSELNTEKFEVERRNANSTEEFYKIGEIEAAGNSFETEEYEFVDQNILDEGIYFYRLRMLSIDDIEYSNVISVKSSKLDLPHDITIYPNPTRDEIFIDINSNSDNTIDIELFTMDGKEVNSLNRKRLQVSAGEQINLNLENLVSGMYLVKIKVNNEVYYKRLSLKK